jgi:hypothetical protein
MAATEDIDRLLAEADELIKRVDSNEIGDMQEDRRTEFEKHAQGLRTLRSEVQKKIDHQKVPESGSPGEGIHEAIADIVKAMRNLAGFLS